MMGELRKDTPEESAWRIIPDPLSGI